MTSVVSIKGGDELVHIIADGIAAGVRKIRNIHYGMFAVSLKDYFDIRGYIDSGYKLTVNFRDGTFGEAINGVGRLVEFNNPYVSGNINFIDYAIYKVAIHVRKENSVIRKVDMFNLIWDGEYVAILDTFVFDLIKAMNYRFDFVYIMDKRNNIMDNILLMFPQGTSIVPVIYQLKGFYARLSTKEYVPFMAETRARKIEKSDDDRDRLSESIINCISDFIGDFKKYSMIGDEADKAVEWVQYGEYEFRIKVDKLFDTTTYKI